MEQHEPPDANPERPQAGETTEDALRRMEARLDRASEAAERLFTEAAAKLGAAPRTPPQEDEAPPPAGWQIPGGEPRQGQSRELEHLINVVQGLRDLIPPDLQQRLAEAVRELLLALRALIDWYLDRIERRRSEPADVQDIPIR